jgi:hypothetical protein
MSVSLHGSVDGHIRAGIAKDLIDTDAMSAETLETYVIRSANPVEDSRRVWGGIDELSFRWR